MEQAILLQVMGALLRWSSLGRLGTRTVRREVHKIVEGLESMDSARPNAIAVAKRQILEELGGHLARHAPDGADLDPADLKAIASGLVDAQVVQDARFRTAEGEGLRVVVKGRVSNIRLPQRVRRVLTDKLHLDRLRSTQQRTDQLLDAYAELEQENRTLARGGSDGRREKLRAAFQDAGRKLEAQDWLEKVQALWRGTEYADAKMAIDYINEAIRLVPDYPVYFFYRGNANYHWGQDEPALRDYTQAIALDPRYAEAYNNRANVHYRAGAFPRAMADYDRAIELNREYADAYNNRGNALYKQQRPQEALTDYDRAIALEPLNALYFNNRAISHEALGTHESALVDYARAIELDPQLAQAYCNRGRTYAAQGHYPSAIADFNAAVREDPRNGEGYFFRGEAHAALGNRGAARRDWRKAAKRGERRARERLG